MTRLDDARKAQDEDMAKLARSGGMIAHKLLQSVNRRKNEIPIEFCFS